MFKTLRQALMASMLAVTGASGSALAAPFSDVVIFGDSLSDTGNVLSLTTAVSPPPFPNFPGAAGRFSNGPVWTEYLAAGLGQASDAKPSNLIFNGAAVVPIGVPGGQNYAFGGARTGLSGAAGPTTGLLGQLIAWNGSLFGGALTRAADPNALYVVVAGANDLRDLRSGVPSALPVASVVNNVTNAVALLAQANARNFLVATLPDLGKTPEAVALGKVAESTAVTHAFNSALGWAMASLDTMFLTSFGVDLNIRTLDFFGLTEALYDDAKNNAGAVFGVTNVDTPCIAPVLPNAYFFPGSTDINCAVSAFSDPLHPSAVSHRLIGQAALAAVPEPDALALLGLAMAVLVVVRRRTQSVPRG